MGLSPLRGSHRAATVIRMRKSHYPVKSHYCTPEAVRSLQTGYRSDRLIVMAFSAVVALHHRAVPEEWYSVLKVLVLDLQQN